MKKINFKFIKFIFFFIVSVPLFLSYSYAEFTSSELNVLSPDISVGSISSSYMTKNNIPDTDYSYSKGLEIINNYISDSSTYLDTFETFVSDIQKTGKEVIVGKYNNSYNMLFIINNTDIGFNESYNNSGHPRLCFSNNSSVDSYVIVTYKSGSNYYLDSKSYTSDTVAYNPIYCSVIYSSTNIKKLTGKTIWDGTYYYEVPTDSPDTPLLPTNSEIAQAVQNFYNSDYYKNNKDFKEFFVLYNSANGVYSFIGHTCVGEVATHFTYGSTLGQAVYSANYPGNTSGLNYWSFKLETLGSQISNFFINKYWLYSSSDSGASFKYDGIGKISDLEEIKFDSRYSTIVYSSTDYLCTFYDYQNDEEIISDGTIPGNQYTDKEVLEPTTNEYNPLKNYVSPSPTDTILSGVDGSSILDIINGNIISWTEMSWVFTSVSSLFNTFSSLLLLICVLLLISKIIGG